MARKPKSVADFDEEIRALQAKRAEALEARAAHIGKLADKAGLTMLEFADDALLKEFKAIAQRFQNQPKAAPAAPVGRADQTT
ncbi:TraC family protein [Litoreibacter roseus]|uniref:TraC-like protein n=1 Tax=Litoreibacter roseus TaxID=2601869 RepID=A0A6N6JM38_9RHOB|nr:TraC family protein [Litoreibacter roseus]GFE67037.1 hypothetical protein KIN_41110 [Litoreibacter roseus]